VVEYIVTCAMPLSTTGRHLFFPVDSRDGLSVRDVRMGP
jgi:hypothetical protein